ncbi:RNA polymerase II accessory factor [Lophiostoma macrostomum CBS 122681]|uniref:RNA polymerase II accessory factor n=1 Tax=Lophiostoma macrostomum CBS 122681 TaxID=1314788 RepID=A0A6A6TA75_9PLEO|nr:RNA polymerase II accessory factor [Lophiostoma macrostomum CBS 122681]
MATAQAELEDPLCNLRLSITSGTTPILTTSADTPSAATTVSSLAHATHITFNAEVTFDFDGHHKTFALTEPTRMVVVDTTCDLRSVYFAWQNKDAETLEYINELTHLNEELPSGAGGSVQSIPAALRTELYKYLNGEAEVVDCIKPLEGAGLSIDAEKSAAIASGQFGGVALDKGGDSQKQLDGRLLVIYDGERKMGDHNTMLRGSRPVDFSTYRKTAQAFFKSRPTPLAAPSTTIVSSLQKKPSRRLEPIILLSPSASSLLRMSNIKTFLNDGTFVPPNATDSSSANLLHLTRTLPSISSAPLRFILVDSTQNFKPPYWARVVAIFTTGQVWQFKSYKFTDPVALFSHYPGVHVGWSGEEPPSQVQAWGRGVLSVRVDKWTGSSEGRWRDREVVESIWGRIEEGMRRGGWGRDGPGMAR